MVAEETKDLETLAVENVGKVDPKKRLSQETQTLMESNIVQCLGMMLDAVVF